MGCWIGTVISDGNNSDVSDDRHSNADDSDCEFLVSLSLSLITDLTPSPQNFYQSLVIDLASGVSMLDRNRY